MRKRARKETTVLNLRDVPLTLMGKVKAAAAFEHTSLKRYILGLLEAHVEELERKGILPKGKG
ncbi:MAG: hypothetical protein V3U35_05995 [Candidatus Neomarinimicrobiota bacterium]